MVIQLVDIEETTNNHLNMFYLIGSEGLRNHYIDKNNTCTSFFHSLLVKTLLHLPGSCTKLLDSLLLNTRTKVDESPMYMYMYMYMYTSMNCMYTVHVHVHVPA